MSNHVIIAIDGPACSGKSTIARNLARTLGFVHLNSGNLYRGVALLALRRGIDLDLSRTSRKVTPCDMAKILADLASLAVFEFKTESGDTHLLINGVNESSYLYTPEVSQGSSLVAIYAEVRDVLTHIQREAAKENPLVLEGRDAGTVVFPLTPYKYYLNAALEVRAQRRLAQLKASVGLCPDGISIEDVTNEMRQRDERDMSRHVTPLCVAEDAKVIDTSMLSEKEVIERIKMDVLSPSS